MPRHMDALDLGTPRLKQSCRPSGERLIRVPRLAGHRPALQAADRGGAPTRDTPRRTGSAGSGRPAWVGQRERLTPGTGIGLLIDRDVQQRKIVECRLPEIGVNTAAAYRNRQAISNLQPP